LPAAWEGDDLHFVYVRLDFLKMLPLDEYDLEISVSQILGLRVAFDLFVNNKYDIDFKVFQRNAMPFLRSFTFDIISVFEVLRSYLKLPPTKRFFMSTSFSRSSISSQGG